MYSTLLLKSLFSYLSISLMPMPSRQFWRHLYNFCVIMAIDAAKCLIPILCVFTLLHIMVSMCFNVSWTWMYYGQYMFQCLLDMDVLWSVCVSMSLGHGCVMVSMCFNVSWTWMYYTTSIGIMSYIWFLRYWFDLAILKPLHPMAGCFQHVVNRSNESRNVTHKPNVNRKRPKINV